MTQTSKYPSQIFQSNKQTICKDIILKYKIKNIAKFWRKLAKKSKERFFILRQWMKTQQNYLKDLKVIQDSLLPALINQNIITQQERWKLFPNLQQMQMLSVQMLKDITGFVNTWDVHKTAISSSVLYISTFFKVYKAYINNMPAVNQILRKNHQQNQKTLRKIEISLPKSENGGFLSVDDYLIKPMQRLTKHKIVIQNYLRAMKSTHIDYEALTIAYQKFEKIVEQNNKDMTLSQNTQKLIKLQKVYGDLILNTRIFLGQSVGYCTQGVIRLYMFNDMLLITRCSDMTKLSSQVDISKQQLFLKIQLDGYSFVRAPMDGRYFLNRMSITGKNQTFDINFQTLAQRNRCYQIMKNVISEYYQKQKSRKQVIRQVQSRRLTALRLSQENSMTEYKKTLSNKMSLQEQHGWVSTPLSLEFKKNQKQTKIISKQSLDEILWQSKYKWIQQPKYQNFNLQFRFIGAQKRYSGSTIYYIFLIQTPPPIKIRQYIFLEFQQIQFFQNYLNQFYAKSTPPLNIPPVDTRPKGVNWQQYRNNFIKLTQFRSICLQQFLNYIFRNKKILQRPQYPASKIFMHQMLWSYITNLHKFQKCLCIWCRNFDFQKQEVLIQQLQKIEADFYESRIKNKQWEQICLNYLFNLQTKLAQNLISVQNTTLQRLLLLINLKFHRLISPYIFPENKTISREVQILTLPVHILNLNPTIAALRVIQVPIKHHTTVKDVLFELSIRLKIQCLRDFELCLKLNNDDQIYYLDQDQYIMQISSKGVIQEDKQQSKINSPSKRNPLKLIKSLQKTFSDLGDTISGTSKIHFYLKKAFVLNENLQLQACSRCQNRLNIIVGQIFYRYKHQKLTLNFNDMKVLCATYYALKIIVNNKEQELNKIKQTQLYKKLDADLFKKLLPEKKWYFLDNNFLRQIAEYINQFKRQNLINSKSVKTLQMSLYKLVIDKRAFQSEFIQIQNTQPESLPGGKQKLLAGVNRQFFIVSRLGQLTPLIQIPLDKLQYIVTGTQFYLDTFKREYHFRGNNVFTLSKYIQMYKSLKSIRKNIQFKETNSLKWAR